MECASSTGVAHTSFDLCDSRSLVSSAATRKQFGSAPKVPDGVNVLPAVRPASRSPCAYTRYTTPFDSEGSHWSRMVVRETLRKRRSDGADSSAEFGNVTEIVERREAELHRSEVYLCGPPPMVDAALALLEANNVPNDQVFYDKFTSPATDGA